MMQQKVSENVDFSERLVQETEDSEMIKPSTDSTQKYLHIPRNWNFWFPVSTLILMVLTFSSLVALIPIVLNGHNYHNGDPEKNLENDSLSTLPQHHFLPLQSLNDIPLQMIEKMESLTLQWGAPGSGDEVKYYFQIEFAKQDKSTGLTTLGLSFGHKLVCSNYQALLYDPHGAVIGSISFEESKLELDNEPMPDVQRVIEDETIVLPEPEPDHSNLRNLGGKDTFESYRNVNSGYPDSFFDAYCRYGCGGMSVTFPYYYRPFFGYGYPLVGTELMFPQGYGGYPAAELLASQAGSVPLQAVSSPRPGNPGNGATTAPNGATGATVSAGTANMQAPLF